MDYATKFEATLKLHQERVSSARVAIFTTLSRKGPISVPALVAEMHKSAIDPATTYRNLNLFRKLNIIRDIGTGNRRMVELSDDFEAHHHHFWCRNCNSIIDFDNPQMEAALHQLAKGLGVQITSHHLELSGLCARCSGVSHK